MRLLGIDYGRTKMGLAISEGKLAEPHVVIRVVSVEDAVNKAARIASLKQVGRVIVGVSEGETGEESSRFSLLLKERLSIPVEVWDETLTTHQAQRLSIDAKIKRKKRRGMEDAYAATLILQGYLDGRGLTK